MVYRKAVLLEKELKYNIGGADSRTLILGAGLIGLALICGIFLSKTNSNNTITVNGQGTVMVKPGKFTLIASRVDMADSIDAALTNGENNTKKMVSAAKRIGGSGLEIKESYGQVTPQQNGKFVVANAISVKSKNVAFVDSLTRYLYSNGATTISNITFEPEDLNAVESQVEEAAIKDAQEKAQETAKLLKRSAGKVVSINNSEATGMVAISEDGKPGTTTIPGSLSVSKNVTVVFEMK